MALSDINFLRGQSGLGRPLAGEDHISGLVAWFTDANLPTGFLTTERIKVVFSTAEAESLGIIEGSAVHGVLWYHINEYFKAQPQGQLYIGLFDLTSQAFTDLELVQSFANGKIRQIGVFDTNAFASANVTTLQASATALELVHTPLQIIYAADFVGATLSTLADLRSLSAKNVSVILGEDGAGAGAALAVSTGASVTALGAALGTISLSNVHENIGWVGKFQVSQDLEFDEPAFADGTLVKDTAAALQSTLQDKGYVFLRKHVGIDGTYFNDSPTAISITNDLAYIENNRTIDKAVRGIRTFLLPNLNGPVVVNADGTLQEETIAILKNDSDRALEAMERDGELSAFVTLIDPQQDVLTTSIVEVTIKIVPVGVARQIEVKIGFAVSV